MFIVFSCKKEKQDKLEGEKSILIGNWYWIHTYHEYNKCEQCCIIYDTLHQVNSVNKYEMRFAKEGELKFYQNDELTKEYRIVFDDFYKWQYGWGDYVFDIHLNNDPNNRLLGVVSEDSLYTWDYPYESDDQNCFTYQNFFIKQ
ncbi:MAG: hypothetical protein WDZ35_06450 [Crocinitomicaceae bacterium]